MLIYIGLFVTNSMNRNRASELIMSLSVEGSLDSEVDKENGLYSLAINRRNSQRTEDTRIPLGDISIQDNK